MSFDKWLYQPENYSLRSERFYADLDAVIDGRLKYDVILGWLQAAYEVGFDHGIKSQIKENKK